jgi:hypothetical protein
MPDATAMFQGLAASYFGSFEAGGKFTEQTDKEFASQLSQESHLSTSFLLMSMVQ